MTKKSRRVDNDEDVRIELALIQSAIRDTKGQIKKIVSVLENNYVTKEKFEDQIKLIEERNKLVRTLVFAAVSAILGGFMLGLVTLINQYGKQ